MQCHANKESCWQTHLPDVGRLFVIVTLFCFSLSAQAEPEQSDNARQSSEKKDYLITQSAGYVGFIALGMGRDYGNHSVNLQLGYVPEKAGGNEIWQGTLKYEWHFMKKSRLVEKSAISVDPVYIGMSFIYSSHDELFLDEPAQYPEGYYPPTAIHSTFNIGTAMQYGKVSFFIEYAALDIGLINYIQHPKFFADNYEYFGLQGIGSLAIGMKVDLE